MKIPLLVLLAATVLLFSPGCAHSDSNASHRRHGIHRHRTHPDDAANTTANINKPVSPQDAGASNAALGPSARDTLGHPAIDTY